MGCKRAERVGSNDGVACPACRSTSQGRGRSRHGGALSDTLATDAVGGGPMGLINSYSPNELAALSSVLSRVTASRSWTNLGNNAGGVTQEEVQSMRIGRRLIIACNGSGAGAIKALFKVYGMTPDRLDKAIKAFYYLLTKRQALTSDYKVPGQFGFSRQELDSLALARPDTFRVADFVTDRLADKTTGKPAKSSSIGDALRNMAGEKFTARHAGKTAPAVCRYNRLPAGNGIYILDEADAKAHAEMKILKVLAWMLAEGTITTATRVQLGGLKAACKKCAKVIGKFNALCDDMIELPTGNRPSANPVNWALPRLGKLGQRSIYDKSQTNIADGLAKAWAGWRKT